MATASPELQAGECQERVWWGAEQVQPPWFSRLFFRHLLKACVKGAVFALEELLPAMLVPVMTPDALDVARGEFTEFTVENSFGFLLRAPSSSRKRHRTDTAIVPRQSSGLIVVQLLLNIWRLWVGWVCRQMGGNDTGHKRTHWNFNTWNPWHSLWVLFIEGGGYGPIFHLHLHSITLIWGKAGREEVSLLLVRLWGLIAFKNKILRLKVSKWRKKVNCVCFFF